MKELPPCHVDSPNHSEWLKIVAEAEAEGCCTSDAQDIADMHFRRLKN